MFLLFSEGTLGRLRRWVEETCVSALSAGSSSGGDSAAAAAAAGGRGDAAAAARGDTGAAARGDSCRLTVRVARDRAHRIDSKIFDARLIQVRLSVSSSVSLSAVCLFICLFICLFVCCLSPLLSLLSPSASRLCVSASLVLPPGAVAL